MNPRFFLLYYDEKRIRELSFEEWRKILREDYKRRHHTRKTVKVTKGYFYFRKGSTGIFIRRTQLNEACRLSLTPNPNLKPYDL